MLRSASALPPPTCAERVEKGFCQNVPNCVIAHASWNNPKRASFCLFPVSFLLVERTFERAVERQDARFRGLTPGRTANLEGWPVPPPLSGVWPTSHPRRLAPRRQRARRGEMRPTPKRKMHLVGDQMSVANANAVSWRGTAGGATTGRVWCSPRCSLPSF